MFEDEPVMEYQAAFARRVAGYVTQLQESGLSRDEAIMFARDYQTSFWNGIWRKLEATGGDNEWLAAATEAASSWPPSGSVVPLRPSNGT